MGDALRKHASVADLLSFYGLYRQVVLGDNVTPQPSYIYAEARLKWNAWTKCKGLSRESALSKWESIYNRWIDAFPSVFVDFDKRTTHFADLAKYEPFRFHSQRIARLEANVPEVGVGVESGSEKSDGDGVTATVTLKRDEYGQIIRQVNEFKNKMQKYHVQFLHNAKQIQTLKKEKEALQNKLEETQRGGGRSKQSKLAML